MYKKWGNVRSTGRVHRQRRKCKTWGGDFILRGERAGAPNATKRRKEPQGNYEKKGEFEHKLNRPKTRKGSEKRRKGVIKEENNPVKTFTHQQSDRAEKATDPQ